MTELSDELVELRIREAIASIEPHVDALEGLLSRFHDDDTGDDDDGGAGLAHLDNLSCVFELLVQGEVEPSLARPSIWSEKERDTWSPFAVEVSQHLYALWPHVVELIELRHQTDKHHGFANIVALQRRFNALLSHEAPEVEWARGTPATPTAARKRDRLAYAEYVVDAVHAQ